VRSKKGPLCLNEIIFNYLDFASRWLHLTLKLYAVRLRGCYKNNYIKAKTDTVYLLQNRH
jgi:hypothetical protein